MADVTTEALQTVKSALTTFQSDLNGLSMRATNNADDISEECKTKVKQTKAEISQVETKIGILNKQIAELDTKIEQATNQCNTLIARIPQLESNICSLNSRIFALNSQIASLRSQLANTEDDEERQQIQEQINSLSHQVSQCEAERSELESELHNSEKRKAELQQVINSAKSQKSQCENELSVQKNRCNKMNDKLERLNFSYCRVESDLAAYVAATKKFEGNASEMTHNNVSAVEKCLESIEQYLSMSLDSPSGQGTVYRTSQPTSGISHSAQVISCSPGEYHYESGSNNTRHAYGQLNLVAQSDRHRSQSAQVSAGGERRRMDDDGGHLIGARFGGAATSENLFPQNMHLNRSAYRTMESEWANLLENNNQVFVDIYTSANGDQMREDAIYGSYTVVSQNGDRYTVGFSFANENFETQASWENDVFNNN